MRSYTPRALAIAAALFAADMAQAATSPIELGPVALSFNGRVQYDALIDSDAPEAQQDEGELRRARLGLNARIGEDWRFLASGDFADEARLQDLSIEYRGWPVRIEVGRLQEPFGLAAYDSSKHIVFMERPSPSAVGPNYGLGGTLNYRGAFWGITLGAFAASDHEQFGGDRNEDSFGGRLTLAPIRGKTTVVHLGVGYSDRTSDEPRGPRSSGSAETALVSGYTPRTPRDPNEDGYRLLGGEFAVRSGPALLTSEYFDIDSDGVVAGDGWYAELGWALTGERRDYSVRDGNFGGIDPRHPLFDGGIGAIELGLRHSETDFSDSGGDRGQVSGVALNWYPIQQLRFSVNALRVKLEEPGLQDVETDVVQGRVQLYF